MLASDTDYCDFRCCFSLKAIALSLEQVHVYCQALHTQIIGNKLSMEVSCQGTFRSKLEEKLV